MSVYQRLKSLAYIIILGALVSIGCKNPDDANTPVTTDIPTIVQISADPPGPSTHYNPDIKTKFIVTVVPNSAGGEVTGGVVVFTLDGQAVCGNGIPLAQNWQAVCVPDKVGGGKHTITAHYNGSTGYMPSSNTATMNYTIDQIPINDPQLVITTNQQKSTFGQKITILATLTKSAETDPSFDGGTIDFGVESTDTSFFGLFKTTKEPRIICYDITGENSSDNLKTNYTCTYIIHPDDFIEGQGNKDDTPYQIKFSAKYKGNDYYLPSDIQYSNQIAVSKLTITIKTTENQKNTYISGSQVGFNATIDGFNNIPLDTTPKLYLTKLDGTTPKNVSNPLTICDLKDLICNYQLTPNDVSMGVDGQPIDPPPTRYFSVQYDGDRAHKAFHTVGRDTSVHVDQITGIKALTSFTLLEPSSQTQIGDLLKLSGDIKPAQNSGDALNPNNLSLILFTADGKQKPQNLSGCTINTNQYACSYTAQANDTQYTRIQMCYKDNIYNQCSNTTNSDIITRKLSGTFSISNQSKTYPIGTQIQFIFTPMQNNYIDTITTLPQVIDDKSQNKCIMNDYSDKKFSCNYTININDYDRDTVFSLQLPKDEKNYVLDPTIPAITIKKDDITKLDPGLNLTITENKTGYPYTIGFSANVQKQNKQDFTGTITISNGTNTIKSCPATTQSCEGTYDIKVEDYSKDSVTLLAQYEAGPNDPYFKPDNPASETHKTIQTCTVKGDINIQASNCTDDGCISNGELYCNDKLAQFTSANTLPLDNVSMALGQPDTDIIHLPQQSSAKYSKIPIKIDVDGKIAFYSILPISENTILGGDLFVNMGSIGTKKYASFQANVKTTINQSPTIVKCGHSGNTTQRMFNCYARTKDFGGIGQDNNSINPPDKTKPDPAAWYLVSCPFDGQKNYCAWLSPEIPQNLPLPQLYASRTPEFPTSGDGRPIAYNPMDQNDKHTAEKKLTAGQRLLWSGELPLYLSKENSQISPNLAFTDVNGLGQIPRCGVPQKNPVSPKTDADNPGQRVDKMCQSPGVWNYYTNLGGYDTYQCENGDTCNFNTRYRNPNPSQSDLPRSEGIALHNRYILSLLPACLQDGGTKADVNCSTTMFYSIDNDWLNTRQRLLGFRNGGPDFSPNKVTDAYKDICTRTNNDFIDPVKITDKKQILINDPTVMQNNWHVPSYPEVLLLTGAGGGCSPGGYFWQYQFLPYCIGTLGPIIGFRAGNTIVPGFDPSHSFFSSSAIQTKPYNNGDDARVWIFEGNDVVPGFPTNPIYYTPLGQPNDPQHNKTRVQRCVSTDW